MVGESRIQPLGNKPTRKRSPQLHREPCRRSARHRSAFCPYFSKGCRSLCPSACAYAYACAYACACAYAYAYACAYAYAYAYAYACAYAYAYACAYGSCYHNNS